MIPIDLVDEPINTENYRVLLDITRGDKDYVLFLGFTIKNEYDNRRLNIDESYNPVKIWHFNKDGNGLKSLPLYGIILKPNNTVKSLFNTLAQQERFGITLSTYKNILAQFNFSCENTYGWFDTNTFPLDFVNLKTVCDDEFNTDKKIFQHLLNINENHFDFQTFASLKLLILKL